MKRRTKLVTAVGCAALVAAAVQLRPGEVTAADHAEAPGTMADAAADLADLYAWHVPADPKVKDDPGHLYVILTFDGLQEAGATVEYDADVLYTIHIDNDMDGTADQDIHVRFGQNMAEEWGVRVDGAPGEKASFEGPVGGTVESGNGTQVWTGLADDPFFFDAQGFQDTLMNIEMGTPQIAFDNTRDAFADTNVTAIALDLDLAAADKDGEFQLWASTGRLTPR